MFQPFIQKLRALGANPAKLRAIALGFSGTVILTSVLVAAGVFAVRRLGALEGAELSAYDTLVRLRADEGPDDRLLIVGISEQDIQTLKQFPIHDGTLAEALQKLEAMQPNSIGIDIARDVPQGEGRDRLIQVLANSDRIIAACKLSSTNEPGIPPAPGVPPDRTAFADLPPDDRGIIRRSILVSTPGSTAAPPPEAHICNDSRPENQLLSLGLMLALRYLQTQGIQPQPTASGDIQIGPAILHRLNEQVVAYTDTDATDYQIMLNYRSGNQPAQLVSLLDVLQNKVKPESVKNRLVLIGYTSTIAKDVFFTPYSTRDREELAMPGVTVHAQATSQILSAVLDGRSLIWYWPSGVEFLWIVGWSLAGGVLAWVARKPLLFVIVEGGAVLVLLGACFLLFTQGGWVPLVPAAIALGISAGSVVLLDRANKGGYTQAVYEQVKEQVRNKLKPDIAIDQSKRQREVDEITQSTYFQDLVARAKAIREKRAAEESPDNK